MTFTPKIDYSLTDYGCFIRKTLKNYFQFFS